MNAMRKLVGQTVMEVLMAMEKNDRELNIMVIDSDLGGSTNFQQIQAKHPQIYV